MAIQQPTSLQRRGEEESPWCLKSILATFFAALVAIVVLPELLAFAILDWAVRTAIRAAKSSDAPGDCPFPRQDALATGRCRSFVEAFFYDLLLGAFRKEFGCDPRADLSGEEAAALRKKYFREAFARDEVRAYYDQEVVAVFHRRVQEGDETGRSWIADVLETNPRKRPFWIFTRVRNAILDWMGYPEPVTEFVEDSVDDILKSPEKFRTLVLEHGFAAVSMYVIEDVVARQLPAPTVPLRALPASTGDPPAMLEWVAEEERRIAADNDGWEQPLEYLSHALQQAREVAGAGRPPAIVEKHVRWLERSLKRLRSFDASFSRALDRPPEDAPRWFQQAMAEAMGSDAWDGVDVDAFVAQLKRHAVRLYVTSAPERRARKRRRAEKVDESPGAASEPAPEAAVAPQTDTGSEIGF